ncbi:MAG TPA: hypothetical protein VFQ88_00435 [Nevskiaceae bacterium]|nr:hypothetical protein [Nevskiaceae bacterium]
MRRGLAASLAGLAIAMTLSGCATTSRMLGITQPDPLAAKAALQLQKLQADPQVAQRAPDALLAAVDAVHAAQHPGGGAWYAHHLAFVAAKRVQIARALTTASEQHQAYRALVAKRDSLGGGNSSIATLAQQPVALPPPTVVAATPLPQPPAAVAAPTPSSPPPKLVAASTLPTAPEPEPEPEPEPAIKGPFSGTHGALLLMPASSFTARERLTSGARDALYQLLPSLAQFPQAKILITGPVAGHVAAVHKQLVDFGVPEWRLTEQHGGDAVEIRFQGEDQTR